MKLAVFIERDGILNQARIEGQHQVSPLALAEFHLNMEAIPLLKRLRAAGLVLIVTTNQPGLSRGYQSRNDLDRMHFLVRTMCRVNDILVCPHDEMDDCDCRKPKPGLLFEGAQTWDLNLSGCFVISDKWQDAEAARAAGCTSVLLKSPFLGRGHYDYVLPDLAAVVGKVLDLSATEPELAA